MSVSRQRIECDYLVIGSGAAGLSSAVTAAYHGLNVVVAEKAPVMGGTTAWSGGWIWAPCNPVAYRGGIVERRCEVKRYLQAVLGETFNEKRVDAFLRHAPRMVSFFEQKTALQFDGGLTIPDTYSDQPGAGKGGRSVIAKPYNGRRLGSLIKLLRKPARETTFHGLTIQAGPDLKAFMSVLRDIGSFVYVAKRVSLHVLDMLIFRRAMQMRNGLALIARLLQSAGDLGVDLRVNYSAQSLIRENNRVCGAVFTTPDGEVEIRAAKGVLLATGGFAHDLQRREKMFPAYQPHLTLAVPEASGDGLKMGEYVGGVVETTYPSAGAWCPVSKVNYADGTTGHFPHIIERGKPGIIGVLANGKRFCNEGLGYHDYVRSLFDTLAAGEDARSWLICNREFQRRYGLGISRPAPLPVAGMIRDGYIKMGNTPEELALACGIDPQGLTETLNEWNRFARDGEDPLFHRGSTDYTRYQGDASRDLKNPCIAPIEKGPYYAVEVSPGSFGTFAGLRSDENANVTDADGKPIPGLYAAGSDLASVMGGQYPAGGINIGPALTFAYIAARHAAGIHEWETDWESLAE